VEYLRRLSPAFRIFGLVEGSEDEIEGIAELQWALRPSEPGDRHGTRRARRGSE